MDEEVLKMIKANYHTHLLYCNHANGHAEDYIEEALKQGFTELGITDHAPVLECFMTQEEYAHNWCHQPMKLDTMFTRYLPEVRKAQQTYKQIHILTGFEVEYLPKHRYYIEKLRKEVDNLNLGIHFFTYKGKCLSSYYDVNSQTIYGYLDTAVQAMNTGLFNTLVHPDLFMFDYHDRFGNRCFDEDCRYVTRKLLECAIKNNMYVEINANGIKNSFVYSDGAAWLYPDLSFWTIAKEYPDLKILIGADAHDPTDLASENVQKVCDFAEKLGLTIAEKMEILH